MKLKFNLLNVLCVILLIFSSSIANAGLVWDWEHNNGHVPRV